MAMYTHKAVTKRKHIPLKQILMIGKKLFVATDIKVTDGKCTVGLYSDAHANEWAQMDNVRLVKNIE